MPQTTGFTGASGSGGSWLPDWWTPERAINGWTSGTSGNQGINATQQKLLGMGIDPRNYATQDDYANAWNTAMSPTGNAGVWTTGGQNQTYGGSSGQYGATTSPAAPAPAPAAPTSPPRSASSGWGASPGTVGSGNDMNGGWASPDQGFPGTGGYPIGGPIPTGAGAGYPGGGQAGQAPGSPGYPLDVNKYLDPSMAFTMANGLRTLGSSASAGGQTFSGNTLKDILGYSQGLASTNYNNAEQQAAQQQGFKYGVDTGDRNFAYQAQLNDQTIPFDQQYKMAQLGLQGQGQNSSLAATLATLLSGNLGTLGQIEGSGTIGSNNSITSAISQILSGLVNNNTLNRVLPQG